MKNWIKQKYVPWLIAILVSLGLTATAVAAEDVTITWVNATQWVDGTPMAAGDIQETIIYRQIFPLDGTGMASPRNHVEKGRVAGNVTTYVDGNQAEGIHCYVARHVATNGEASDLSNESCFTVDAVRPNPPTNLMTN